MSDTMVNGMRCLNCDKRVGTDRLKLFAGVVVCDECHEVATLVLNRGQAELKALSTLLVESVRTALVEGTLRLPSTNAPPSKGEVLGTIITMNEAQKRRRANKDAGRV